jgi:hypothetical protein
MPDITKLILSSTTWLVAGIVLYSFLSLKKVFLNLYVHPKLETKWIDESELWKFEEAGFWMILFTKRSIYHKCFLYLFRHKHIEWPVVKNVKLKRKINILDGLTAFLKPYLIFALLWVCLNAWIASRLWFDSLTVPLATVQQHLYQMEQFVPIRFLVIYKNIFLLVLAIVFICIPYFYDHEEISKRYRRLTTSLIVVLSLLGNISFFGAKVAGATAEKTGPLLVLKGEIIAIHDQVYRQGMAQILANSMVEVIEFEEDQYWQAKSYLDTVIAKVPLNSLDSVALDSFRIRINDYRKLLHEKYTLPSRNMLPKNPDQVTAYTIVNDLTDPHEVIQAQRVTQSRSFDTKMYQKVSTAVWIAEYNKTNVPQPPLLQDDYVVNEEKWNLRGAAEIKSTLDKINAVTGDALLKTKFIKIAERIIDYLVSESITEVFSLLSQWWGDRGGNKFFEKTVSLLITESPQKKKIASLTVDFLAKVKSKVIPFKESRSSTKVSLPKPTNQSYQEIRTEQASIVKEILSSERTAMNIRRIRHKVEREEQERLEKLTKEDNRQRPTPTVPDFPYTAVSDFRFDNDWEKLRLKMYRELYKISCPFIVAKRDIFYLSLRSWEAHLTSLRQNNYTRMNMEDVFWAFASKDEALAEAFARAIMWYKGKEIMVSDLLNPTIADALSYYGKSYPLSKERISQIIGSIGQSHACKN